MWAAGARVEAPAGSRLEGRDVFAQPTGQVVVKHPWLIENGFLTPTLKIKRAKNEDAYGSQNDAWYRAGRRVPKTPRWDPLSMTAVVDHNHVISLCEIRNRRVPVERARGGQSVQQHQRRGTRRSLLLYDPDASPAWHVQVKLGASRE